MSAMNSYVIPRAEKTCINCAKQLQPKGSETWQSDKFARKMFCSEVCNRIFRRRQRQNQPQPDVVLAEILKRQQAGRPDVPDLRYRDAPIIDPGQGPYRPR